MPQPSRRQGPGLVDACVAWVEARIEGQVFRPGDRLPSIRALARTRGVSPFTVVAAYDRLADRGLVEARAGSGVYVRPRAAPAPAARVQSNIDLAWLMRHMLDSGRVQGPGLGVLPPSWLDGAQVADSLRALGREGADRWLAAGGSHGFAPLRDLLQQRLAGMGVVARPDQIVLTTGITQALDLVLRELTRPGDAVLVPEPCWFGALGMLAARGLRIVGVPCGADGPDLDRLERLVAETRPRLMILTATAHNPTGFTLTPEAIDRILAVARAHDVMIFEDDVYADLGAADAPRFAARGGLDRVIYAGSFSKTLASNLRVGFIAAAPDRAQALADAKILGGFTTPEINERLLHRLLSGRTYSRRTADLRTRLDTARRAMQTRLEAEGFTVLGRPQAGLFLWVDMGCDTNQLAVAAQGQLIAPGALFSPDGGVSTWMRVNVATPQDQAFAALMGLARAQAPGATDRSA